jgi:death on curing protein
MRYIETTEVMLIYQRLMAQSGGMAGVRDQGALESALAQPQMSFGGEDLYPSLAEKAAALGYSLIQNHPFLDGNKRIGHATMEIFLMLNGFEIGATVDESEHVVLAVAAGEMSRSAFAAWVESHLVPR